VLRRLPRTQDPRALVGHETHDDAAVYRLSDTEAIVETVDFFTPVVDDPFLFGRIAAANALSDIWAMGARPLFALNLVGFPVAKLPLDTLGEILRGGADAAQEAGIPILGGHSIDDPEPKYGMAVTGIVHPDRVLRNVGARAGDRLLLTKPLGSGIVTTAIKRGIADADLVQRTVRVMAALNLKAGEVLAASGAVHALTDVTGFGLLGHAWEMAQGSAASLRLRLAAIPVLDGVRALAAQDVVPGGSKANLAWVAPHVRFDEAVDAPTRAVLADAQTNGGLLAAIAPDRFEAVMDALRQAGVQAHAIGEVLAAAGGEARIEVVAG
jgi:selenide, water dikinase